jgi:hypothetical protein
MEEFNERVSQGEQLVLLDDLVLDISSFKHEHPGGEFLLDFHKGKDVSKFFYGGYVLENQSGMKPYTHSNVARTIVNKIAVAKLYEQAITRDATISNFEQLSKSVQVITFKLADNTPSFQVPNTSKINSIGRHYLIRSM